MTILLVSSGSGSRGGGEIFLDYLGEGLVQRGHEVLMWIPAHPRMDELAQRVCRFATVIRAEYRSVYDHRTRTIATALNRRTSHRIAHQWQELRPDVIHVNKQNLEDGLDLLRAAHQSAIPSVCTIHLTQTARYLGARMAGLRDRIARKAFKDYAGVLVAVQETRRAALQQFVDGKTNTRSILNGVPIPNLRGVSLIRAAKRHELNTGDADMLVLGVGRLVEQKQPDLFLKIASKIHQQLPASKFLWIGDGSFASRWDEWVERAGLRTAISRVGWRSDVRSLLFGADLLLHVARYEGLPLAVAEAMATRLPCAVTRDLAQEIPFLNENNVLFVDDFPRFLKRLQDPTTRTAIATQGRELAEREFSLEKMAESYERVYAEAAKK
jgi:glycosyltransferase involved in cell wall biosynthesis